MEDDPGEQTGVGERHIHYAVGGVRSEEPFDGGGAMLRRYVHGAGADVPLVWYEGAGVASPRYLYADHQGSIVAIADANGTPVAINSYDEWSIPQATNIGRFQYTGQA